jgi:glycosyltransferase involved in cell wall biosynthesis
MDVRKIGSILKYSAGQARSGGRHQASKAKKKLGQYVATAEEAIAPERPPEPKPAIGYRGPDPHLAPHEVERLRSLKGSFAGNRIFVMGNGPSLNDLDLNLLEGEYVFCMNRVSLLFERVTWRPQFYTAFDLRVVPDNLDEFNALEIPYKFFSTKHKGAILEADNHFWYHDWGHADFADRFSGSPEVTGFGGGGTVACVAIQIASFLGFDPIILIGCDASYSVPTSVKQSGPDKFGDGTLLNLESTGDDDVNHFDPRYFGAGKRWHAPNAAEMHVGFEKSYRAMRDAGRSLVNATAGGALECVPRVSYERLFAHGASMRTGLKIGVDLTHETAAKATGMRNSLIATLRNTEMMAGDTQFYLICSDDGRDVAYRQLDAMPRCRLVLTSDPSTADIVKELDVVLSPFNDIETELPLEPQTRRIAYINDLIPLHQPGFPDVLRDRYTRTAAGADALICLTEETKATICQEFGISPASVFVSPPATEDEIAVVPVDKRFDLISADDISDVRRQIGIKFTYLAYPAAFRPHKNHDRLIEAMRYVYTNLQLVLTTGETHDPKLATAMAAKIAAKNMSHRILVAGNLDRSAYYALLKGAEALVYPSLEEGFGIPVAEAQALQVPVIASRRGSLAEVADGSLEIDPEDHLDIAEKITTMTSDEQCRAEVVSAGLTNVRRYTKEWGAHGLYSAIGRVMEAEA